MPLPKDLLAAYRATEYQVQRNGEILTLKIDVESTDLLSLYQEHAANSFAFITAFNPESRDCNAAFNRQANESLKTDIIAGGWSFYTGQGTNPNGEWPPEDSFCILGISYRKAVTLSHKYVQNAFVYAYGENIPRLVYRDHETQSYPFGYISPYHPS